MSADMSSIRHVHLTSNPPPRSLFGLFGIAADSRLGEVLSVRRRESGMVLVFALIAVLILSVIMLGITTAATTHYTLARTQVDQAAALDVAEAGVHYEINKMTRREYDPRVFVDNG